MADPVGGKIHDMPETAEPARYVMIVGFLGAGKTTAVARLARHLTDRGRRGGLLRGVKGWGRGELGAEAREAIKGAAILHLDGPPDHFVSTAEPRDLHFDKAVEIARLLGDPELTAVARTARHPTTGKPGIPPPLGRLRANHRENVEDVAQAALPTVSKRLRIS